MSQKLFQIKNVPILLLTQFVQLNDTTYTHIDAKEYVSNEHISTITKKLKLTKN